MAATRVKSLIGHKVVPGTSLKFRNNKSGVKIRSVKSPAGSKFRFKK